MKQQIRFKKGDLLKVTGPSEFPFDVKFIVTKATRGGKKLGACLETTLRAAEYHGRQRYMLNHWDSLDECALLDVVEKDITTALFDSDVTATKV